MQGSRAKSPATGSRGAEYASAPRTRSDVADTIPARLFEQAEKRPGSPAFYEKVEGEYRPTSWAEYAAMVRRAGKALIANGFRPGGRIAILGFNRPEWVILDVATMSVGGAPAGIYTTSSPEEVQYITAHAEAPLILVENKVQLDKVLAVRSELPDLKWIVTMRGAPDVDDPMVVGWDDFLATGDSVPDSEFDERLGALQADDLATLIYTSGTTGPPKGVMLTHGNLTWTVDQSRGVLKLDSDDRLVSYLPLSHIAEQMFSIHIPITKGSRVYFAESIDGLLENLKEVEPTVFFAVPRVWEKFHTGITAELSHATGARAKLAAWAQKVGRKATGIRNAGSALPAGLSLQMKLAAVVHKKVKAGIGMRRVRAAVSGAAPISPELLDFFAGFDITVLEVYGQSEGTGPTTFNRPGHTKFGTVGPAFPGCEVKLAEDGEILLKGGNVFAGYFKNPEATAETIEEGWLLSGDLGSFDEDGFLTITGRKKDIIITAGGKNIAPKDIEAGIKDNLLVSEAVLIGDRRKYLVALLTLDPEATAAYADEKGLSGPFHESGEIRREIQATIDGVNKGLAKAATVKKFAILPRELTIDDGELTGTLKVKRNKVVEHFAEEIEALYSEV
jgi:long-chain acyl-CoA synthetase